MIWGYRIIKENIEGVPAYYIAEVYYEGKKPVSWSEPVSCFYESRKEVVQDLKLMLRDSAYPTLEVGKDLKEGESSQEE